MHKTLSIIATLLLAGGLAIAQDQSSQPSSSSSNSAQSSSQSSAPADQNAAPSSQTSSPSDQSATPSTSDQNANAPAANDAANSSGQKNGKLPQTASPLPLIALLGMGSVAAGLVSRRKQVGNEA